MEITSGLLVALLFVTLLGLGIANVVAAMAGVVGGDRERRPDGLLAAWTVLLLLVYLELFWHTVDLLNVAEWQFTGFLYVILGPILLFFATNVLLPGASVPEGVSAREHYLSSSSRFFGLLALVQVWIIGVDQLLGSGFTTATALTAAAAVLVAVLASTRRTAVHVVGTVVAAVLFVVGFIIPGAGG
jgi:hypothetical protein